MEDNCLPWGIFIFEGSDSITFCIAGIGLSSLSGGNGKVPVINRFADGGTVLGHGVGPPDGMDVTGIWQVWQWLWFCKSGLLVVVPWGNFVNWDWVAFFSLELWPWFGHWGIRNLLNSCTGYIVN